MTKMIIKELYNRDFIAWADEQALLLEQQRWDELDLVHLIQEVRDLGNRHRDALESQLTRLLMHLLKWQYQPEKRSNSWKSSIREAKKQIDRLIRKHPVLKIHLEQVLEECYLDAREDASDETSLNIDTFPISCPYSIQQIRDREAPLP
ncbi:MAG: DUF29 domain-containing protein [Xenococcaceae cyanobacterium MO_234.B1]|nr:DUF29 domain-containing protein [Xenococcaceae cyanobacterium MO_234.B1]